MESLDYNFLDTPPAGAIEAKPARGTRVAVGSDFRTPVSFYIDPLDLPPSGDGGPTVSEQVTADRSLIPTDSRKLLAPDDGVTLNLPADLTGVPFVAIQVAEGGAFSLTFPSTVFVNGVQGNGVGGAGSLSRTQSDGNTTVALTYISANHWYLSGVSQSGGVGGATLTATAAGLSSDGTTDDRTALAAADVIGNAGRVLRFLAGTDTLIGSNYALSNLGGVEFEPGATIKVTSGATLTIDIPFKPNGRQQCFDVSAGGSVILTSNASLTIDPDWFGALRDVVVTDTSAVGTDSTFAFAAALKSQLPIRGKGDYRINDLVVADTDFDHYIDGTIYYDINHRAIRVTNGFGAEVVPTVIVTELHFGSPSLKVTYPSTPDVRKDDVVKLYQNLRYDWIPAGGTAPFQGELTTLLDVVGNDVWFTPTYAPFSTTYAAKLRKLSRRKLRIRGRFSAFGVVADIYNPAYPSDGTKRYEALDINVPYEPDIDVEFSDPWGVCVDLEAAWRGSVKAVINGGTDAGTSILGYGVNVRSGKGNYVTVNGTGGRHLFTTDHNAPVTYSDSDWMTQGVAVDWTLDKSLAVSGGGCSFDMHEGTIGWTISDCHVKTGSQQTSSGGAVQGGGFNVRGLSGKITNCSAQGCSTSLSVQTQFADPNVAHVVEIDSFTAIDCSLGYEFVGDADSAKATIKLGRVMSDGCADGVSLEGAVNVIGDVVDVSKWSGSAIRAQADFAGLMDIATIRLDNRQGAGSSTRGIRLSNTVPATLKWGTLISYQGVSPNRPTALIVADSGAVITTIVEGFIQKDLASTVLYAGTTTGLTIKYATQQRQVSLLEAAVAPGAVVGASQVYFDSADGDLKVMGADGVARVLTPGEVYVETLSGGGPTYTMATGPAKARRAIGLFAQGQLRGSDEWTFIPATKVLTPSAAVIAAGNLVFAFTA